MDTRLTLLEVGKTFDIQPVGTSTDEIVVRAVGDKTGEAHVSVEVAETGKHQVIFTPLLPDDYTLNVLHHGSHVKGSPYKVKALEKTTIFVDEKEVSPKPRTVTAVEIDSVVNFVLRPEAGGAKPEVIVTGPFGPLETTTVDTGEGRYITRFVSDAEGEYYISAKRNGTHLKGSPVKVLALCKQKETNDPSKCYVLPEDVELMSTPYGMNELVDFRVSTRDAGEGSLNVHCRGPAEAHIAISKVEEAEYYVVTVAPFEPGRYRLNVTWNGVDIKGSPYVVVVKDERLDSLDVLNLSGIPFRIGKAVKFKVHCAQLGEETFDVQVEPYLGASVTIRDIGKRTYHVTLVPRKAGDHKISVLHNGKHIAGSPFSCYFQLAGDASKCFMIEDTTEKQNDIDDEVSFTVSTEGAGEGTLTASVQNVKRNTTKDATVTKITDNIYGVKFNLDQDEDYLLSIKYDNNHIVGSPFKLSLSLQPDPLQCHAEGEGLVSAYENRESSFTVTTDGTGSELRVEIEGESETVQPVISQKERSKYRVAYTPKFTGEYKISIFWNNDAITGSPFKVISHEYFDPKSICLDKDSIKDIVFGQPFSFVLNGTIPSNGNLKLTACSNQSSKTAVTGEVLNTGRDTYVATFDPPEAGKYTVHILYGDHDISGSPFKVKVALPSMPHKVKAHGPGLEGGIVGQSGNFTVDTKEAGPGSLTVRVHGSKGTFTMNMNRDPSCDRTILVSYNPTAVGVYLVDIEWSGVHVPGSPYRVNIQKKE